MKKAIGLAVMVSAALLAGCASHEHYMQRLTERLHSKPLLTVRSGVLSVAPDPIVFKFREPNAAISWQAPAGFTFPADGIEVLGIVVDGEGRPIPPSPPALKAPNLRTQAGGKEAFRCESVDKGREFTCRPVAGAIRQGVYRYAMRLVDRDQKRIEGDPYVFGIE